MNYFSFHLIMLHLLILASTWSIGFSFFGIKSMIQVPRKLWMNIDVTSDTLMNSKEDADKISSIQSAMERLFLNHNSINKQESITLTPIKALALEKIKTTYLPSSRAEAWRHTSLRLLFQGPYENALRNNNAISLKESILSFVDETCTQSYFVFIDGYYHADLSCSQNANVEFQLLRDATENDSKHFLHNPDELEPPRNKFGSDILTYQNVISSEDACIITAKTEEGCPVQILHISSGIPNTCSFPNILIKVPDETTLTLKQSHVTICKADVKHDIDTPYLVNGNTKIIIGNNANFQHTYVQSLSTNARHVEVLSATVGESSRLDFTLMNIGSRISRTNLHIDIEKSHSNITVNGLTLSGENQHLDFRSSIAHGAESSNSAQQQRIVLGEKGEAIFKGRIRIPETAQFTESDQQCRTLMLGDRAKVVVIPTLEITADNVVCSHGAAIADLDENAMFYLASRGIDRNTARKFLLKSFAFDVLVNSLMDKNLNLQIINKLENLNIGARSASDPASQKFTSM